MADPRRKLLRLGVSGPSFYSRRPFNVGGIGTIEHRRPFDVLAATVAFQHARPFNVGTYISLTHARPFDVLGPLLIEHRRPFDVIADAAPEWGGWMPGPSSTAATTLSAIGMLGATSITVTSATGIAVGQQIVIGSLQPRLVTSVAGTTIGLSVPLEAVQPSGTVVVAFPGTTTSAGASAGATSLTVGSTAGITVGSLVAITTGDNTEYRAVLTVSPTTITFAVPLAFAHASGTYVTAMGGVMGRLVLVYTKEGVLIGAMDKVTITVPRSRAIGTMGQAQFTLPASAPSAALVLDDCIVAVVSAGDTWAGVIGRQTWNGGAVSFNSPDILETITGVPLTFEEQEQEIDDNTPAQQVASLILSRINSAKAAAREVQWEFDGDGVKVFRGDLPKEGDATDFLRLAASRSQCEYAWAARIEPGRIVPILQFRDTFTAPVGVDFVDGPGAIIEGSTSNVEEEPTYVSDPSAVVRGIKLTGAPSRIAKYAPDWAHWAIHEVTPEVEMYLPYDDTADPGDPRHRVDLQVSVDWGLSKTEERRLAQLTEDRLWVLFDSYVYAWHDMFGMPFHPEWAYEGPPEDLEPELTLDKWRTHQDMGIWHTTTLAHIVMVNREDREWLAVIYYRTSERKVVRKVSMDDVYKFPQPSGTLPVGTDVVIYEAYGKTIRQFAIYTWQPGDEWEFYNNEKKLLDDKSVTVRGIKENSPFDGKYIIPSRNRWVWEYRPAGDPIEDVGALVTRVWGFERLNVKQWDPRRDGVGEKLNKESIHNARLTTRARWRFVPFSVGEQAETTLAEGIWVWDQVIFVESMDGFPAQTPFYIRVGDDDFETEDMLVTSMLGTRLSVRRGVHLNTTLAANATAGDTTVTVATAPDATIVKGRAIIIAGVSYEVTDATGTSVQITPGLTANVSSGAAVQFTTAVRLFETGTRVRLVEGKPWEGFEYEYDWPEGRAYIEELMAVASKPRRLLSIRVTNADDTWATVQLGSTHVVNIQTEGPPGGVTGSVRVLGYSPNEEVGTMEVIVEWLG